MIATIEVSYNDGPVLRTALPGTGSHRFALKKGCILVTFNPDRILDQMLETFVEYNNWLTFKQLADRLTGDPSNDQLIAGIVHQHSRIFMVTDGCRCKLRTDFIEDAVAPRF